ncbi:MAG: UpxY family transcription antiterminator [Acidobacteriaceae bacterium]|nr:UpxY family transcription antiterminator [Acidobacteriaceae bacterium]
MPAGGNVVNWFALHVKPRHEKAVEQQLNGRMLEGYSPYYFARRHWSDRVKEIELPIFPRYVFCRFSFEERLKVLSIPSVISIVSFGGAPCPVNDADIETIKGMVASGLPLMPWPCLRIGERVRISHGPLSGLEGILTREKAAYRVVVTIELLQRAVAVEVARDLIVPATNTRRPPASSILTPSVARLGGVVGISS